jgi:hypothetical protein
MRKTKKTNTKTTCKNCNNSFDGNFFNNCGQSARTDRINFLLFKHETNQGISRIDSGILYSIKQLFLRPGHSVREYIEGKRVKHYKPISLVVILATTYGILIHFLNIDLIDKSLNEPGLNIEVLNDWTTRHYSWITIATIPFYTIGTYICFRRQGYNISELLILNFFKAAQRLSISITALPLLWHFSNTSGKIAVTNLIFFTGILFTIWTDIQFFNKMTKMKACLLSILSQIIFIAVFSLLIMVILSVLNKLAV